MLNLGFLGVVCIIFSLEAAAFIGPSRLHQNLVANYPVGAIKFMGVHALPARTFAAYQWGGYVLWQLAPRYKDFIDGRANTLFNTSVLNAYLDAYGAAPDWSRVLSRYGVGTVLVPPHSALAQVLRENTHWRRAYQDGSAAIYARAP